jgi:glycosyltransferase involved in cell wall biosynthesis
VLITVIIPTKNRSEELKRAIQSVLNQTHQEFEILVVDDHSEEKIAEVVELFNDQRIKYFKSNKTQSNANVCRNIGLLHAQGEFIAMLDSDDEWMPFHLESKLSYLIKHNLDGVFGSYFIDDGESRRDVISRALQPKESMADYLMTDGRAATPTHFYKAKSAKQVMWDEQLFRHQDYDFSIRFAKEYKFVACPEISCIVHWNKNEKRKEHIDSQILFIKKHVKNISPKVYNNYHQKFDKLIFSRNDISKETKNYFKKNKFKYIHDVSLNEFLGAQSQVYSKLGRFLLRIKYSFRVLFKL